jgi:rhamnosyltransferase
MTQLDVAIIIRSLNEQLWFRHCLEAISEQETSLSFQILLVDSGSTDNTLKIAKEYGINVIHYTQKPYIPGQALNLGFRSTKANYYIFLSAHCIPTANDWLDQMIQPFDNPQIAGVYCRQLPLESSSDADKRDLYMTFRNQPILQTVDPFFHNAASAIRSSILQQIPFSELHTNAEDRIWGQEIISRSLRLYYTPFASVFHHHGIHHGSKHSYRTSGVLRSIQDSIDVTHELLPSTYKKGKSRVAFIFLASDSCRAKSFFTNDCVDSLLALSGSNSSILLIVPSDLGSIYGVNLLIRDDIPISPDQPLGDLVYYSARLILDRGPIQDLFVFANLDYPELSLDLISDLLDDMHFMNYDMLAYSRPVDGNVWYFSESKNRYLPAETSLMPRSIRNKPLQSFFGLGTVFNLAALSSNSFPAKVTGLKNLPFSSIPQRTRTNSDDIY